MTWTKRSVYFRCHNDDGRAALSRIEIDAHGSVQGEQGALIAAKTDRECFAILQQGHESDLNRPYRFELHDADRTLDCGASLDRATDKYIAAAGGKQEQSES